MSHQLQEQFIFSLKVLDLYRKNKDLQNVVKFLEQPTVKIKNEGDEKKILLFMMIFVNKYPEVLTDRNDQALIDFVSIVLSNLKHIQQTEIKHKPSSNL